MDEQHNQLMAYVLDEPEKAAREIQRLRNIEAAALRVVVSWRLDTLSKASLDRLVTVYDQNQD